MMIGISGLDCISFFLWIYLYECGNVCVCVCVCVDLYDITTCNTSFK